nr:hypothetical protein CTI12_AA288430 [Tanacetum cinerariifolium]
RFLLVDYEQMLYSLYQNCRQSSQTVTEYAKEFTRLASCNQLSESNVQQVTRFNNGLQYDIQVIISLQTTRTIDEAIRIALKAEQTLKKQGIGSSMYKIKMDTNQSSSSQSGGDAQVDHSKSTHEVDGGKKKTTTTTTSTHAVNKSFINLYARPVGIKCYRCQEVSHTLNQCRATKRVNLAEGVLTNTKKSKVSQRHNIFQTRCKINQDVFNVIVNGGSSENIISRDIMTHLKLTLKKHPKP